MRRLRILALSMPLMIFVLFLLVTFGGNIPFEKKVNTVWKSSCRNTRIPDWGIIRNKSQMEDLFLKIHNDKPEIRVNFEKEMIIYLVTGSTEEGLENYVMDRIILEDKGFSILCRKENRQDFETPLCQIAVIPMIQGEGLFRFP